MFRYPESEQHVAQPEHREQPQEAPQIGYTAQVVDQALRFAVSYRTRDAWRDWARTLSPQKRAIFEAIHGNESGEETSLGRRLPAFSSLPSELRRMLEEAFRVWGSQE